MLKKLRMGQILDRLWVLLLLAAMSIFMLFKMGPGLIDLVKGPTVLSGEARLEDMVGEYVSWTADYPVEEYMETTKTTKINGVSTGTKKSRSSWLVLDEQRGICLSIEVSAKRYDEVDRRADLFYQSLEEETELAGEGIAIAGTLEILDGEELRYFKQMAGYVGLPVEGVVYHIGDEVIRGESKMNILGISFIGIFLLLIVVFIVIKTLKNSAKKLIGQYLEKHPGITMEQLESDFDMAENVNKVWIGKRWTFSPKLGELLFDNRQVVWVHCGSVRSGRSVNFYVWWYMIDGSEKQVSLSSEKKCKEVMEKYSMFAHILVGNDSEYGYMLRNDKEALLDIKYRPNQMEERDF